MKVLAVFNSKGGSGKSTISIHLAVAAAHNHRVALFDLDVEDGSETTTVWGAARGDSPAPHVQQSRATTLETDLEVMRRSGADLVILDCPPTITAQSAFFISKADFVVVPVQPTMPDVAACHKAVRVINSQNKPFAYLLNSCPPASPELRQAQEGLAQTGELCPVMIGDRVAFFRALADGLAVTEVAAGKATEEAEAACSWILNKVGIGENHAS